MTIFVAWPNNEKDAAFRQRYLEITGENIQETPQVSEKGLYFQIGTSKATNEQLEKLASEFPAMAFSPLELVKVRVVDEQ